MSTIKGENIERLNGFIDDNEECTGNPHYCPCMLHYNERRRLEGENQPQKNHAEQLDNWTNTIMGNHD